MKMARRFDNIVYSHTRITAHFSVPVTLPTLEFN